ncbi:hypothetical protein, partial [Bradyrhizobium sp. UNPF46]|uniref:hypothetical protein n=1 Tax=Bradyrhizobium sp. UNPF46 TaxID=1141168 RepID=UPI001AEDFA43
RVRAAQPLTGQTRPAIAGAPMHSTSTATRPAYRDDRETPLVLGPGWRRDTTFPNFGQSESFGRILDINRMIGGVSPDEQERLQGITF